MSEEKDPFVRSEEIRQDEARRTGTLKGKFEAGEHQWLGMRGATLACQKVGAPEDSLRKLRRRAGDVELTYGEIVALSGDFYGTPEALFDEKPSPLPWLYEANDLSDLRKRFAVELAWIEDERRPLTAGYPDNNLAFWWNAKSYVELAENNTDHFGWHNVVAYCRYHGLAIQHAIRAQSEAASDASFIRALYFNGFADHFLTDGFAAGHIRVPRAEIREWAQQMGYGGKLAGLLSKVLHDQDGHVSTLHARGEQPLRVDEGLPVQNSLDITWSTRCDGQLFLVPAGANDPLVAEPVNAVAASLVELYTAQRQKVAPKGEYQALQHVPFPRPGAPTFLEKFQHMPSARIEELLRSVRWYTKLPLIEASLNAENISSLFAALPELMGKFASNVARAYDGSDELRLRLPKPYVQAFRKIT